MSESNRVVVFVDGNNLYHRLKERGWPTWIEIGALAQRLAGKNRGLVRTYYYNAAPPSGSAHEGRGNYYLAKVSGAPNIVFKNSRLQRIRKADENGSYSTYREKGADTAIATDMVVGAASNEYDIAILVSSDGDFAPTVEVLGSNYGKTVEVVYFKGSMPLVMQGLARMREFRQSLLKEMDRPPRKELRARRSDRA